MTGSGWRPSGRLGRVSAVLGVRPADIRDEEGVVVLSNEKQHRRVLRSKTVYVSRDLVSQLPTYATGLHIGIGRYLLARGRGPAAETPISRQQAWRIVARCSRAAGVAVRGALGQRPASALDFRHGAAVHQLRAGVSLQEIQQLGHVRLDSTAIYLRLANPERQADHVQWR